MLSSRPTYSTESLLGKTEVTQGQYPLSIGTSLAFETLFGINENIKPTDPLPYTRYGVIFINIRTIIRNLHGAVVKELRTEWSLEHYYREVIKELAVIPNILADQSHDKLVAVYYIAKHQKLEKEFPNANFKKRKQATSYDMIEATIIDRIIGLARTGKVEVMVVDFHIPLPDEKCLMMTHMPVDLIPYAQSNRVDLIETHTGVIKDKFKWYTKLSGSGLERIPFTRKTIQIFGDGKTFAGLPPKQRAMVVDFAEKNKWNQTTTDRVIVAQMARFPDKEVAKIIAGL